MGVNRVFLPQETLDQWLTDGRVEIHGETMTLLPERQRFLLKTGIHFLSEVAGGGDEPQLVGKVKDLEQIDLMGGEHCADSVILDDNAYQVVEGFVGEPIVDANPIASGSDLAAATRAAVGDNGGGADELDLLARFFLE
jgi:hypothetical protein